MIPAAWYAPLPSFLWQVGLHASVAGLLLSLWARHRRVESGRARRQILGVVLVLPLFTAAVPGRNSLEFREGVAWLDSGRLLAVPLVGGLKVYHVVLVVAAMMIALTIWQEVLPALRRPRVSADPVPEPLLRLAHSLPRWHGCEVVIDPAPGIGLATSGWPWRPRLIVSRDALERLTDDELAAALRHEHAHWDAGRWLRSHALFVVRLVQCYSPVALWSFREYCLEVEIACDAAAAGGRSHRALAAALLKIYEATDRRDVAARSALRRRVELLVEGGAAEDGALPTSAIAAAAAVLLLVLPWLV